MAITFSAKNRRGNDKPFVAKIVGTDRKFKFAREFLPNPCIVEAQVGEVYQERDTDSNMRRDKIYNSDTYYLIEAGDDGKIVATPIDESRAYAIASKM